MFAERDKYAVTSGNKSPEKKYRNLMHCNLFLLDPVFRVQVLFHFVQLAYRLFLVVENRINKSLRKIFRFKLVCIKMIGKLNGNK